MKPSRSRHPAKHQKRSPGWLGVRLTVCGATVHPDYDLVCLLPPNHTPAHLHSSLALGEQGDLYLFNINDADPDNAELSYQQLPRD